MEKWLKKTEKFIALLLLLDLLAWAGLHWLPETALPVAEDVPLAQVFDSAVTVRGESGGLFGNISLETEGQVSVAQAFLLINGQAMGDFSQGRLTVRVYPGDRISVDGGAYQRRIVFHVVASSAGIDRAYLPDSVSTDGNVSDWGVIVFK